MKKISYKKKRCSIFSLLALKCKLALHQNTSHLAVSALLSVISSAEAKNICYLRQRGPKRPPHNCENISVRHYSWTPMATLHKDG